FEEVGGALPKIEEALRANEMFLRHRPKIILVSPDQKDISLDASHTRVGQYGVLGNDHQLLTFAPAGPTEALDLLRKIQELSCLPLLERADTIRSYLLLSA